MCVEEATITVDGTECCEVGHCMKSDGTDNGSSAPNGSSGGNESFRTYKRRKQAKMYPESKTNGDGRASGVVASQLADQIVKETWQKKNSCEQASLPKLDCHAAGNGSYDCSERNWRNRILEHMYQSLCKDEGGIQGCIREALASHQEIGCMTTLKKFGHSDRKKCPSQIGLIHNGSLNAVKEHADIITDGSLHESDPHTISERCLCTFYNIIISEKFTSLCKLLFDNFQGLKIDSLFDFSLINSRMKAGAYERTPVLFSSDIQQVWKKFQRIGTEMISLAKSLSDVSVTSYQEQVEDSVHSTLRDGKHTFCVPESGSLAKREQTEACGPNGVCNCRCCGKKANARDCLVCDSCEEIYHVSCIKPTMEEIPSRSWYCASCTVRGIGSPHENCVACERLNAPKTQVEGVEQEVIPTNKDTLDELEENSNCSMEDGFQLSERSTNLRLCKVCGSKVENSERFMKCGHSFCPGKYYHERCLTMKQLKTCGPCWYCPSCLCRVCLTDKDDDKIVLCDGCTDAYHIYCMQPPHTSIPKGEWFCRKCEAGIQKIRRAKRAYEEFENKKKNIGKEEGKRAFENIEKKPSEKGEKEEYNGRGRMDMLLSAVKTLKYEENLAVTLTKT